jgi:hypothetical protein
MCGGNGRLRSAALIVEPNGKTKTASAIFALSVYGRDDRPTPIGI